jgi:hypothetical protein
MNVRNLVALAFARREGVERRVASALVGAIALYYAVLGLIVLRPEAVYSGDIGVKYVQAQALVSNGFRSMDIPYPGAFLDPERRFFPIRPPFVLLVDGAPQAIFPPVSAVTQAAGVAVAGFRGMIVLTLASAALILYAARRLAPDRDATVVVLALGLASPLWFYAVSGWEHAPGVALGTLGFAVALTSPSRASALLAGMAVGAGSTIRDEVILLVPGLLFAVWLRKRRIRPVAAAIAGVLIPLALAMALEVWWFERPAAAHLRHAVHLLQTALNTTDAANPDVPVLRPMTLRQRYEAVVQYWLLGYGIDRWIIVFGVTGAIAFGLRWRTRSSAPMLAWLAGVVVLAWLDLYELITLPKWLAGLHRVAPYLVFALFLPPRGTPSDTRMPAVALVTTGAYLALAFIGADTHGGKSLGPRLLLPLLPLLTVAAITRISAHVRSDLRLERWTGAVGVLLLCMSLTMHLRGTTVAYYYRNRDDVSALTALAESRVRVVVADDAAPAQVLMPLYRRKVIFLADSQPLASGLGAMLAAQRVSEVVLVSRHPEPVTLDPLRLDRTDLQGRMLLQYYRR